MTILFYIYLYTLFHLKTFVFVNTVIHHLLPSIITIHHYNLSLQFIITIYYYCLFCEDQFQIKIFYENKKINHRINYKL